MEAFESFVALAMEAEDLVVGGPYYFRPSMEIREKYGLQNSSFEVDLVGARKDRLVLATVKSYLGSDGVKFNEVRGIGRGAGGYKMLNRIEVSETIIGEACEKFGYERGQIEFRLYAGKFQNQVQEQKTREWASQQTFGGGPLLVFKSEEVLDQVQVLAQHTNYIDNPSLVAVKVMNHVAAEKAKRESGKKAKGSKTFEPTLPIPVGSFVRCPSDGFSGFVMGYSTQNSKTPYVKIFNADDNVTKIRSVNTVEVLMDGNEIG